MYVPTKYHHQPFPTNSNPAIQPEWEKLATCLCNAEDADLGQVYMDIEDEEEVPEKHAARVVYARDTRASGHRLAEALKAGLAARDVVGEDFKYMTTPQLHYIVRCYNTLGTPYEYGEPTEKGYYEKLAAAWKTVMAGRKTEGRVVVDCANGVGGPKLHELIKYLPKKEDGGLEIKVVNDDVLNAEALNHQVSSPYLTWPFIIN
jgi:phosphoacetylglucosamine mutase